MGLSPPVRIDPAQLHDARTPFTLLADDEFGDICRVTQGGVVESLGDSVECAVNFVRERALVSSRCQRRCEPLPIDTMVPVDERQHMVVVLAIIFLYVQGL